MKSAERPLLWMTIGLVVLIGIVLGEFLFDGAGRIPSHPGGDTARYLASARDFTSQELLRGNLPLWNPHVFSGTPYVGIFQSSVLYPANALYLVLPLASAITLELALHVILLGAFSFVWLQSLGLRPAGSALAALAVCLGAGTFMRVLAGQLTVLDTQTWTPLLLASVHATCRRPSLGWTLGGIAALSMMILAGHPPTLLMAGFVTALYALACLVQSPSRLRSTLALAIMPSAAIFVGAAQLFTGLAVASEGVRGGGISYDFATSYSFPPESLLTLLVPHAFARVDGGQLAYWGRWFYWDASAYAGVIALILGVHGARVSRTAASRTACVLAPLLVILALGRSTPFYALLYHGLPGFDFIRAPSKFMFFAILMAAPLVAAGADASIRSVRGLRATAALAGSLAFVLAAAAAYAALAEVGQDGAGSLMGWLSAPNDLFVATPTKLAMWRETLVWGLTTSALLCAAATALLLLRRAGRRWAAGLLLLLGAGDLLAFAHENRGGAHPQPTMPHARILADAYRSAGDDRVLELGIGTNAALTLRRFGAWGYDPVVLDRYARLMARTQGWSERMLERILSQPVARDHPALRMLRVRYEVAPSGEVTAFSGALPRLLLVEDHLRVDGAEAALDTVMASGFDPRRTVVLESDPVPPPRAASVPGTLRLVSESTDALEIEAELQAPALLLISDAYARGWRARALPGSQQTEYTLLPADYVLRAVPLSAGRHRLVVEYAPAAFRAGAWASSIATWLFVAAALWWGVRTRQRRRALAPAPEPAGPGPRLGG